jgi:hypothetical protein
LRGLAHDAGVEIPPAFAENNRGGISGGSIGCGRHRAPIIAITMRRFLRFGISAFMRRRYSNAAPGALSRLCALTNPHRFPLPSGHGMDAKLMESIDVSGSPHRC